MYDLIAIGDIVTDAFIRLKEASVHCDIDKEKCTISMLFGAKIPYDSVEVIHGVGNSSNAAVSAARLGLSAGLVANLGDDPDGKACLESLERNKVSTDFVTVHHDRKTNYHYVLWYEDDRTILVKHEQYEYKFPQIGTPKWIYLSSLGDHTLPYHGEILNYLNSHSDVYLAFQPGTFQIRNSKELEDIYKRTQIFFCNVQEAEQILGADTLGIEEIIKRIHAMGPETVVITDGPKGAYGFDGAKIWFQSPYPDPKPPYDRTGAGDALASTTVSALILGKDLPTALRWGMVNAMSVVQQVGAQKGLLSRKEIESLIASAPEGFQPKPL